MLGETANIRCNKIPYFQIFIIPDKVPYFDYSGNIKRWEHISAKNLKKYITLSNDNIDAFMHTPNKTLLCIVNISGDENPEYQNKDAYKDFYVNNDFQLKLSEKNFELGSAVIYNDYEEFIKKLVYTVLSL